MNKTKFEQLGRAAKSLAMDNENPYGNDFWNGYLCGLRRAYHGENFGNDGEHKMWMSLDGPDKSRKMRGVGYRAGFNGMEISQASELLALDDEPKKTTELIVRKIPEYLRRDFKSKCASDGISQQDKIIELMRQYVNQ